MIINRTESAASAIGADLQGFGGILRCSTCCREQPLGNVGTRLRYGWPSCCGYTMLWVTQRLLDEEQAAVPGSTEGANR